MNSRMGHKICIRRFDGHSVSIQGWLIGGICVLVVFGVLFRPLEYVALLCSGAVLLLCNQKKQLCLMLMLMSFANLFKAAPGTQSFFTIITIAYVLRYFIGKRRVSYPVFIVLVLGVEIFMVQLFNGTFDAAKSVKFVFSLLFLFAAYDTYQKEWLKDISLYYILGIELASLTKACGLFPQISLYTGELYGEVINGARVYRFAGLYNDPNYYSINLILALCIIVCLYDKKMLSGQIGIALSAPILVFIGMTGSKSALFMLVMPVVLLVYSNSKNRKYFLQIIFILACVIGIFYILSGKAEIFNKTIDRLLLMKKGEKLTTGRIEIWEDYVGFFLTNLNTLLIGSGVGAPFLNGHAAHNTVIETIYHIGLVGGTALLSIVACVFRHSRHEKKNIMNYSLLLCLLAMYMFVSQLFSYDAVFQLFLASCFYMETFAPSWKRLKPSQPNFVIQEQK